MAGVAGWQNRGHCLWLEWQGGRIVATACGWGWGLHQAKLLIRVPVGTSQWARASSAQPCAMVAHRLVGQSGVWVRDLG